MKKGLVVFLFLMMLTLSGTAGSITKVTVSSVNGDVKANVFGIKWETAFKGMKLYQNSKLKTGKDAWCEVEVSKKRIIKVQPNSIVGIAEINYTQKKKKKKDVKFNLFLKKGKVFSKINKKLKSNEKFRVSTPAAVCGVRGTEFSAEQTDKTTVSVLKGLVSVASADNPELEELIKPGFYSSVSAGASPTSNKMSESQMESLQTVAKKKIVDKSIKVVLKPEFVSYDFNENQEEKTSNYNVKVSNIDPNKQAVYLMLYLKDTAGQEPKQVGKYEMKMTEGDASDAQSVKSFSTTVKTEKAGQYSFRFSIETK